MDKNYHIDTSVLMESENVVEIMRNGAENQVNISITVLNELDALSKTSGKSYRARRIIDNLWKNKELINFTGDVNQIKQNDDQIVQDSMDDNNPILVTNDKLMKLKAYVCGVSSEGYRSSSPFNKETEIYTGFVDYEAESLVENCFFFKEGKLFQYINGREKCIGYENHAWNVTPKDKYQNAALELMLNPQFDLVTVQSKSGTGKTLLSLASAMKLVLEKKLFKKIIIIKYPVNIGTDLGYLPGAVDEKMQPYWKPMYDLLLELNEKRESNKLFINNNDILPIVNPRVCEFMPVNYLRGQNVDQSLVIIDEAQNIPRDDMRTILSRMGENVKVICEGDASQVDNNKCNTDNNGLNWIIKKMTGYYNYGHLTMNCKRTRGAICDMVIESGL